jgi:hypothetical protein
MLDRPEQAAVMAAAAQELVAQQYRPERIGPDLTDIYETCLDGAALRAKPGRRPGRLRARARIVHPAARARRHHGATL